MAGKGSERQIRSTSSMDCFSQAERRKMLA
jgi:hypothetical protein